MKNSINDTTTPFLCGSGAIIERKFKFKRDGCLKCSKCSGKRLKFGEKRCWGFVE